MNKLLNFNFDETLVEKYKAEFIATNCIFLSSFLKDGVLNALLLKLANTNFETKFETEDENKFGKVLCITPNNPIIFTFNLLFNNLQLFNLLEMITGCEEIGNFTGRIHRSEEGENHQIDWHGDNADTRLLAMTIGLGKERYLGANFELREKETKKTTLSHGQLEAGDALIFKIHPTLEHRLASLTTGKRTVGVGWFRAKPDYETYTRNYLKPF